MIRGWILFSTLILSVIFKLWPDYGTGIVKFPFSDETLNNKSWVYFTMEHIIAIGVALCVVNPFPDHTPKWLLWLFFAIICVDLLHYVLFYRDKGIGFNLFKVFAFGIPLLILETKELWRQLRQ